MLTIGKSGAYATLHRMVTMGGGSNNLGISKITALDATRQSWLLDFNHRRAMVSVPQSYPNLVVDEYAQEQADAWAIAMTKENVLITDASFGAYQIAYNAAPGAMYSAGGVLGETMGAVKGGDFLTIDAAWFNAEKRNCPNGNWSSCPFSEDTGHYINGSNTNDVWVGLGYDATASVSGSYYYDVLIAMNIFGKTPSVVSRRI